MRYTDSSAEQRLRQEEAKAAQFTASIEAKPEQDAAAALRAQIAQCKRNRTAAIELLNECLNRRRSSYRATYRPTERFGDHERGSLLVEDMRTASHQQTLPIQITWFGMVCADGTMHVTKANVTWWALVLDRMLVQLAARYSNV